MLIECLYYVENWCCVSVGNFFVWMVDKYEVKLNFFLIVGDWGMFVGIFGGV